MINEKLFSALKLSGADYSRVLKEPINEVDEVRYINSLLDYLKGYDFMKLGHDISNGQWGNAQTRSSRMGRMAMELGLMDFHRLLAGIRQNAAAKNKNEAKQLLAVLVSKRVRLLLILEKIKYGKSITENV